MDWWAKSAILANILAWVCCGYVFALTRRARRYLRETRETRARTQANLDRSERLLKEIIAMAPYNNPEKIRALVRSLHQSN